jgi:uncharacterized protein with PQ loop repeat
MCIKIELNNYLIQIKMAWQEILAYSLSSISIVFYTIVFIPQLRIIYKTKSSSGISLWTILVWTQADYLSLFGCILSNLIVSSIVLGYYHIMMEFVMIFMFLKYTETPKTFLKIFFIISFLIINLCSAIILHIVIIHPNENAKLIGNIVGWFTMTMYIIGRIPQIRMNYQKKSTKGLSLSMYIFTIIANMFYVSSVIAYSIEPDYLISNIPWILNAFITICMDIFVIWQIKHYKSQKNTYNSNRDNAADTDNIDNTDPDIEIVVIENSS